MTLDNIEEFEKIEIKGKTVLVPYPTKPPEFMFIGRKDVINKTLAAWLNIPGSTPLNFRLFGPPGIGKNAMVYELARILKKDIYIINGHDELGPEDIACSATMTSKGKIDYVASTLFAAMLRGGICFFDEIGKAPQSALDPLASVLDDRRAITSVLAGIHLKAHPEFLFCSALNEDEETGVGLPGFIDERTRPAIHVGYPSSKELELILRNRFSASDPWIEVFISEFYIEKLSTRTAITLLGFACRLARSSNGKTGMLSNNDIRSYLLAAYAHVSDGTAQALAAERKELIKNKKEGAEDNAELFYTNEKETVH